MSVFKSAAHLAAWAGVCPGNNESAGKRMRSPAGKGNVHLMTALVEAAQGGPADRTTRLRQGAAGSGGSTARNSLGTSLNQGGEIMLRVAFPSWELFTRNYNWWLAFHVFA
jgi:hypothetical protein